MSLTQLERKNHIISKFCSLSFILLLGGCKRFGRYLHFPSMYLFSFSVSIQDDIIKLTIEHLTFTLIQWNCSWCSLANRKINIHSCIQRTWLLLCEFYTIFLLYFFGGFKRVEKKTIFLLPFETFAARLRFMCVIYIQLKRFSKLFLLESFTLQENKNLPHGNNFLAVMIQQCCIRSRCAT